MRDQNTYDTSLRRKRLMTLLHLFLIHRYKAAAIHYLTPTEDNQRQSESLLKMGLFDTVHDEVGEIIVADINPKKVADLVASESQERERLIAKA